MYSGKKYVIEEGNSSKDFGLGNISNLSVGASYTFLKICLFLGV